MLPLTWDGPAVDDWRSTPRTLLRCWQCRMLESRHTRHPGRRSRHAIHRPGNRRLMMSHDLANRVPHSPLMSGRGDGYLRSWNASWNSVTRCNRVYLANVWKKRICRPFRKPWLFFRLFFLFYFSSPLEVHCVFGGWEGIETDIHYTTMERRPQSWAIATRTELLPLVTVWSSVQRRAPVDHRIKLLWTTLHAIIMQCHIPSSYPIHFSGHLWWIDKHEVWSPRNQRQYQNRWNWFIYAGELEVCSNCAIDWLEIKKKRKRND